MRLRCGRLGRGVGGRGGRASGRAGAGGWGALEPGGLGGNSMLYETWIMPSSKALSVEGERPAIGVGRFLTAHFRNLYLIYRNVLYSRALRRISAEGLPEDFQGFLISLPYLGSARAQRGEHDAHVYICRRFFAIAAHSAWGSPGSKKQSGIRWRICSS